MTASRRVATILAALACGSGGALAIGTIGARASDPQRTTSSRVALFGHLGFVSPSGIAGVFVGCFGPKACVGKLTVKQDGVTVGRRDLEVIAADDGGIVHVQLSSAARRALAHGYLRVTVAVRDVDRRKATARLTLVPFETTAAVASVADATSAGASARIKIFGHTGFVNPGGTTGIFLGCFGSSECAGAMTLTAGRTVVGGRSSFYISPNDGGIVHVPLRANGRRLLAEHQRLVVTVTVKDTAGPRASARVTLQPFSGNIDESTLVVSPATVRGNSSPTFDVALTNASSPGFTVASAKLTAPPAFKLLAASLPAGAQGSATVAGDVVELRNLALAPNATLHVRVAATVPASCKTSSYTWGSSAWMGAYFDGKLLTRDPFRSSTTTTVSTACALRFVTEPAVAVVGKHITGAGAQTPVRVAVVDGQGRVVTSSIAPITVGIRDNPGRARLRGTTTVHAVHGVASFTDLTLDALGNGYTLTASSPKLPATTSSPFDEASTSVVCAQDQTCETKLSRTASDFEVTANADPSKPNAGTLSESVDVGTPLQCHGYTQLDPNWWEFSMSSANRSKTIVSTLKVPLLPLSGTLDAILGATQACLGALSEFTTSSGKPAPTGTLPDGTRGFIGLLPNCTGAHGPCVVSRTSGLDLSNGIGFDIVLTIYVPEGFVGDPWMRL